MDWRGGLKWLWCVELVAWFLVKQGKLISPQGRCSRALHMSLVLVLEKAGEMVYQR